MSDPFCTTHGPCGTPNLGEPGCVPNMWGIKSIQVIPTGNYNGKGMAREEGSLTWVPCDIIGAGAIFKKCRNEIVREKAGVVDMRLKHYQKRLDQRRNMTGEMKKKCFFGPREYQIDW